MVRLETSRFALHIRSQRFLDIRRDSLLITRGTFAERNGFLGQRFAGSHHRVGTMTAEIRCVFYSRDCELRWVKEFWGWYGGSGGCCRQQSEVDILRFLRTEEEGLYFRVAVSGHLRSQDINS